VGTLVATRCQPVIRAHYHRLLAAGKPQKLALVACLRKLLTILTASTRHGTAWLDDAASSVGVARSPHAS
jgi:transposase